MQILDIKKLLSLLSGKLLHNYFVNSILLEQNFPIDKD